MLRSHCHVISQVPIGGRPETYVYQSSGIAILLRNCVRSLPLSARISYSLDTGDACRDCHVLRHLSYISTTSRPSALVASLHILISQLSRRPQHNLRGTLLPDYRRAHSIPQYTLVRSPASRCGQRQPCIPPRLPVIPRQHGDECPVSI